MANAPHSLSQVCESCLTAFEPVHDFCPNCDHPRPSDGWNDIRHFPDNWLGKTIERYRFVQRLGRGGTGSVYRARRQHLDEQYAVKIIEVRNTDLPNGAPSLYERVER